MGRDFRRLPGVVTLIDYLGGAAAALRRQGVRALLGVLLDGVRPASRCFLFLAGGRFCSYYQCDSDTPLAHRNYDTVILGQPPQYGLVRTDGKQGPDEPKAGCGCAESSACELDQTPVLTYERALRPFDSDRRRGTSPRLIVSSSRRSHIGWTLKSDVVPLPSQIAFLCL